MKVYTNEQKKLKAIKKAEDSNRKFFIRLKYPMDFSGIKVLDVGCGQGQMCFNVAEWGGAK
ncbi:MAG: hypothetical protein FWG91_07060 [Lachnospiraceae bacterium]|nr:hypothetical protein [Lachnospiraceae bacterium]